MDSLYHQTNRMIQGIQNDLGRLEKASDSEVHMVENEIQAHIDSVVSNCERLDILVNKEPPNRRPNAKLKVDQMKYDCQHLQSAMRQLQTKRYLREEADREREALLSRSFTANDSNTSIMIDAALEHNTRMQNSHREVDNLIGSGQSIIGNLREQRLTLKGVRRKILDIGNTLGLSNTVMRYIEKRTHQDKFLLFGGMILTCIIMFLIWKYFG